MRTNEYQHIASTPTYIQWTHIIIKVNNSITNYTIQYVHIPCICIVYYYRLLAVLFRWRCRSNVLGNIRIYIIEIHCNEHIVITAHRSPRTDVLLLAPVRLTALVIALPFHHQWMCAWCVVASKAHRLSQTENITREPATTKLLHVTRNKRNK